jgi:glutathione synthase
MNSLKLAVIMDPIASIKPSKDSTLAMLLAAQARGWQIHYGELNDIWLRDGQALGNLQPLRVDDDPKSWFELDQPAAIALGDMDAILMRKDPPFNMEYIYATYILEHAEECRTVVVNRPQSLRDANEKAFVSWFPECSPPTMIARSMEQLRKFIYEHRRAVIKPLDQMAGRSVFVTGIDDPNRNALLETMTDQGTQYVMVQMYIPEIVDSGDARILLIDGNPIPQALVRTPSKDDHRGNISTGATIDCRPLTNSEQKICERIGPVLREKGLLFAGIDVIGGYLTEINVTSPTGIRELDHLCNLNIADLLLQRLEAHVHERSPKGTIRRSEWDNEII